MNFHFTHPWLLALLPPAVAWVVWLAVKSDVQVSRWRRWTALGLRLVILLAVGLALAGLQWLKPLEGLNVFYLLDRSDSIPPAQQEWARDYVVKSAAGKKRVDLAGVIVFGSEASIETMPRAAVELKKIQTVIGTERTDVAAAVRLGTAAFPETGQKRLVLVSDGNENAGDALAAVLSAKPLGVSVDVLPLGVARSHDVAVKKVAVPPRLKQGQTFEAKIFIQADTAGPAKVRLLRNDQLLGAKTIDLQPGKNLFTFPQTLTESGFYTYEVQVDAPGDPVPQNNHASAFASVQGNPRVLFVSAAPEQDRDLVAALSASQLEVKVIPPAAFPANLAELQSYDAIFLCNVEAGAVGPDGLALLESGVRDFGVGLVCVGGDRAYAAGGYRNTPLETTLPVSMELDSKKVLPPGAVVLVMHGMEFNNGNEVARECAFGVLQALGPQDEMGVVLWDGTERWLFPLRKVGDKQEAGRLISGMNQGDLGSFQGVMTQAHEALRKSNASLKHIIVFSDGDPAPPTDELLGAIAKDKITVSTVLISGHAGPETMMRMADLGGGRFYNVTTPAELPQIFIKETAVILKSAIYEEPFKPQLRASSEILRGIAAAEYPQLLGYVATTPKPRAETPLWTAQGDPLLAHWQYGLGRAVAFTSDAKARWARDWLAWAKYRQFWSQVASWSLRRLENADFTTDLTVDKGEGQVSVEAVDAQGDYRNFLNLQAAVISPKGQRQTVRLEQVGPGRYEARFPTKEIGVYMLNLMELKDGRLRGSQVVGASVNYSPEFNDPEPNLNLLRRLAGLSGGRMLDPRNVTENPFLHDRQRTFQPRDLWEWLLKLAIVLFPLDVGVRRIQIEREEWQRVTATLRRWLLFWRGVPRQAAADESLAALLSRRDQVRGKTPVAVGAPRLELFRPKQEAVVPPALEPQPPQSPATSPPAEAPVTPGDKASTASQLLAARRKVRKPPENSP